ncbi:hypothetical protein DPMN_147992 [Dreissena polymorpha]|uniref:Uncharacterized protein n=1 Tax=Dreissena polymorpha TaxID=45954 RepID=A0A9D4FAZ6_DREPO|nr:hypothetical protein DPMN_147992 [Dreissena polymorpha]
MFQLEGRIHIGGNRKMLGLGLVVTPSRSLGTNYELSHCIDTASLYFIQVLGIPDYYGDDKGLMVEEEDWLTEEYYAEMLGQMEDSLDGGKMGRDVGSCSCRLGGCHTNEVNRGKCSSWCIIHFLCRNKCCRA